MRYDGKWSGELVRRQCTERGGAVGIACASIPALQPFHLELAQAGDEARGVLVLGRVPADVSGVVTGSGALLLEGGRRLDGHAVEIVRWRSVREADGLRGSMAYTITPATRGSGPFRWQERSGARPARRLPPPRNQAQPPGLAEGSRGPRMASFSHA